MKDKKFDHLGAADDRKITVNIAFAVPEILLNRE